MHMLPTKDGLILKVCGDDPSLQEEAEKNFLSAIESMKLVYTKTQLVYEENNVLDLPWYLCFVIGAPWIVVKGWNTRILGSHILPTFYLHPLELNSYLYYLSFH